MSLKTYLSYFFPKILFILPAIVPSLIIFSLAIIHLKKKARFKYYNNIIASIVSLLLPVLAVYDYFTGSVGDGQAGLIFLFLPFYAAILGIISYIIGSFIIKRRNVETPDSAPTYNLIYISALLIIVFVVFSTLSAHYETYMSIAEKSTNISELTYLHTMAKKTDDSGIYLFLAQNPNLSAELLEKMYQVHYPHVRVFVAQHHNTSMPILEKLIKDENQYVRKFAQEELRKRYNKKT